MRRATWSALEKRRTRIHVAAWLERGECTRAQCEDQRRLSLERRRLDFEELRSGTGDRASAQGARIRARNVWAVVWGLAAMTGTVCLGANGQGISAAAKPARGDGSLPGPPASLDAEKGSRTSASDVLTRSRLARRQWIWMEHACRKKRFEESNSNPSCRWSLAVTSATTTLREPCAELPPFGDGHGRSAPSSSARE